MACGVRSTCSSGMPYSSRNASRPDVRAIPWMLWTIWKNRNSLLYAEVQESTLLLAHIALEESTLWNELNKVEQGGNQYLHDLGAPEKWAPPAPGLVKCNMHANWRNDRYLTGGAWITRDHRGEVGMHARVALLPSPDRLSAEMNCLLWVLRSLRDLRLEEVSVVIDFEVESRGSNKVAIEIAKSVLRDGRLQSYLALGGPSWLHDLIQTEVTFVNS
ncbi:unnamed protein product [Brassica oleracea var. botrytis]